MNSTSLFIDIVVDNNPVLQYFSVNNFSILNMIWNLLLMIVPFFICLILIKYRERNRLRKIYQKITAGVLFIFWVLFIPNTAYIITDARHMLGGCELDRYRVCGEFVWTILFFFLFGAIGWIVFVALINQMKLFIKEVFGKRVSNFFPIFFMPIISLGMLMGLVQRWNSWELFFSPVKILNAMAVFFTNGTYFINWFIFSIIMLILYFTGDRLFGKQMLSIVYELFKNRKGNGIKR